MQDAVKKETAMMAAGVGVLCALMLLVFFALHRLIPDTFSFGIRVIYTAVIGFCVAWGNFFWMALTVQKVASIEDEDRAKATFGASYRYRTMMQLLWVVISLVVPAFYAPAGIIPLFFPSILIKIRGLGALKKQ